MNNPKVSVIVPVYNVEPYIHQCLDSLTAQTLSDLEIVIVDDGSPDHCPEIVDGYARKDSRMKVIHKKNAGVSAARNDGIEAATGEYIYFADSDDWLEPDALNALYTVAKRDDADIVEGDYFLRRSSGTIGIEMFPEEFTTDNPVSIATLQKAVFCNGVSNFHADEFKSCHGLAAPWHHLIRAELIQKNHIRFNPAVKGMYDDGLFSLEIFEFAKKVSYLKKKCYNYRIIEQSLTKGFNPAVIQKYLLALQAIDDFSVRFSKDESFRKASMVRRFVYLNLAVDNYFQNPKNEKTDGERYKEFREYSESEPFACMYGNLDPSMLGMKRNAFLAWLITHKHFKIYWQVKKISR